MVYRCLILPSLNFVRYYLVVPRSPGCLKFRCETNRIASGEKELQVQPLGYQLKCISVSQRDLLFSKLFSGFALEKPVRELFSLLHHFELSGKL